MLTYVEPPGFVKSVGGTAGDGAAVLTINVTHLAASVSIFFSVSLSAFQLHVLFCFSFLIKHVFHTKLCSATCTSAQRRWPE